MFLVFKFVVCFCFVVATQARTVAEMRAYFLNLGMECTKDHPVSPEEMLQLHQHQIPDSPHVKCLLACVYRKAGWMDSSGMLDVESSLKMIEREHADDSDKMENSKKLFDECKKVNDASVSDGNKGCERAYLLSKCMTENAPKMGFEMPL